MNSKPTSRRSIFRSFLMKGLLLCFIASLTIIGTTFSQVVCPTQQFIKTTTPPTMTGAADGTWSSSPTSSINNTVVTGNADGSGENRSAGWSASWQAQWDATNLYILVQVTDAQVNLDPIVSDPYYYNYDAVELYIQGAVPPALPSGSYGANDFHYGISNGVSLAAGLSAAGVTYSYLKTGGGYNMAIKIPLSTIGASGTMNSNIGFDVAVDNNDHTPNVPSAAYNATYTSIYNTQYTHYTSIGQSAHVADSNAIVDATNAVVAGGTANYSGGQYRNSQVAWHSTLGQNPYQNPQDFATVPLTAPPDHPNPGSAQSKCIGSNFTLAANNPIVGTGTWSIISVPAGASNSTAQFSNINAYNATFTPSPSVAGNYVLTWNISNNPPCTTTYSPLPASVTMTLNALPAATISYAGSPYCTSAVGAQPVTQTGTVGGTYTAAPAGLTINAATGAITPSTSTAGTYTVTYTMAAAGGCPIQTATTSVTITTLPAATISYAGSPYCTSAGTQTVTQTGTVGGTYSAAPAGLTINGVTGAITPSTSTAGTYTVTYTMTGGAGCTAQTATTSVTITTLPAATISYAGTPFCTSAVGAQPVTQTGTPGGTYTSAPAGLIINAATGAITPSTSTAGTYTVTYTMAAGGGCTAQTATTSVTITTLPAATISYAGTPFCTSAVGAQPVTRTGTIGGTYTSAPAGLIINAATGAITPSTSTAGTYTVTYTMAAGGGCLVQTATTSVTITTLPAATISYAGTPFCTSAVGAQPVTQTGTIGGTYTSAPAGLIINAATGAITPSTSTAGTYTVTYTMAAGGGCTAQTATTSVTITTLPAATISYAGSPYCTSAVGAQAVTRTGTAGGTYTSAPAGLIINAATGAITPSTSAGGTYTVTYTMAAGGGCLAQTATTSVTIYVLQTPVINCSGSTVTTVGFDWSPGVAGATSYNLSYTVNAGPPSTPPSQAGTTFTATGLAALDVVALTVTPTGVGCFASQTHNCTANNCIPLSATINYAGAPFCSNTAGAQPVTQTGTTGGTYSSTAGLTINAATGAITPSTSTPGTYTVTYTMLAGVGCVNQTATTSVTITPLPTATISYAGAPFCSTDPVTKSVTQTGTIGGTYSAAPVGLSINAATGAITPSTSTAGTYTVTYTMAAAGGCLAQTATTSVTITALPVATINYAGSPFCSSLIAAQSVTQTGTVGGTYSATPAGLSINPATGAITPSTSTAGIYTVTYTMAAGGGCTAQTATTSVTITTLPVATITYAGSPYCVSTVGAQAVTRTGTAGGTYTAAPAGLAINAATGAITPSTSTTGTYTVTYTIAAAGGCLAQTATTSVTVNPLLLPVINCSGSTVTTVGFDWSPGVAGATSYNLSYTVNGVGLVTPASQPATTYTATGLAAGDVVALTVTPTGVGCFASQTHSCTANNCIPLSATINYAGSPFCSNTAGAQPVTQTGTTGGTYSSTAGLTINAATGAITPSTSTPGTYTVTYTMLAGVGCVNQTATTSVTITALPTATISYAGPFCSTDPVTKSVTQTGTIGGTYSAAPVGLSINAATGAITPSTSTAGTYTVTYTMAAGGGCLAQTATTSVTITALPTATISYAGSPFCSNTAGGQAVTQTGAIGGTYSSTAGLTINGATGAITPSSSTPGTYTVTYTMAAGGGCGAQTATTSVTITALPTATISYAGPFCSNDAVAKSVTQTGTIGGTYSSTAGLIINGVTGAITPSGSVPGTYTVTYTMAPTGGCLAQTATTSVTITTLPAATISYAGPFCSTDPAAEPVTQTGTLGGTYSSTAGLTINGATGAITPSTSTPGTYTVTYTMAPTGGCLAQTATTSVTISTIQSATISYAGPFCSNDAVAKSVTRTGTPGGSYSSTAGLIINAATGAITPLGSTPGTYTVTYTMAAAGGCTTQITTTSVIITTLPVATINYAGSPFCSSDPVAEPVTQTGTIGGTYSSTAGLLINSVTGAITPSGSTPGTYTVTYTMAPTGGCLAQTATTSIIITTLPVATINYPGSPFCSNDPAAKTVTRTGTIGGTYTSAPAGLIINAATGAVTPFGSTPGTYTVTYTMAAGGGCLAQTATTSVTITTLPVATISYATPFCSTDAAAEPVTQTGTLGGTYSSTAGLIINAVTGAITPASSTPGTYTVTYTMAPTGGCTAQTATTSVTITTIQSATISYAGSPFCSNTAGAQAVTHTGTIGGVYSSTAGLTINAVTGAVTPSSSTPGTYTVTYTMAATGGCGVQTTTTSVTITALPVATISYAGPFCSNDAAAEPVTQTGTPGGAYSSTVGLAINPVSGAITPSSSTPGTYTVTYTMAAGGGCTVQTATTSVTITTLPVATINYPTSPLVYCTSSSSTVTVTQTGTPGGTYSAVPVGLTINAANGAITPSSSIPGTYTVTYTMAATGGCTVQTATASVTINLTPEAPSGKDSIVCSTTTLSLTAHADLIPGSPLGTIVQWYYLGVPQPNNDPTLRTTPNIGDTAVFYAEADPLSGCNSTTRTRIKLTIAAPPSVSVEQASIPIDLGYPAHLVGNVMAAPGYQESHFWTSDIDNDTIPDKLDTYVSPLVNTLYTLTGVSSQLSSCIATKTVNVIVLQPVTIPNVFSPNNDRVHDTWYIKNLEQYPYAEVDVFNRYGQFIYQSQGNYLERPWDGTYNGQPVPVGEYYYIIKLNSGTVLDAKPIAGGVSVVR